MNAPYPVACSLTPEALRDRIDWISALNRNCLLAYSLDCATLHLTYDAAARHDVRALIARERMCCRFLRFEIRESGDTIELRIRAPVDEEMNVELLFAPFLSGAR
jgi:hypothetical protein